jgi:protein gp37
MADKSSIEWTDATWNPITGCTKVSPGCDHCYAERIVERFKGKGAFENVTLNEERLDAPLRWRKPRRVFVNSMSDLFHDSVPDEYIAKVFAVMALSPRHTFQVLTKRHARMRSLLGAHGFWAQVGLAALDLREIWLPAAGVSLDAHALPNVWLGVSVEDQKWADIRVPALLDTPAAVRFLSCEPLLGPVNIWRWIEGADPDAECLTCGTEEFSDTDSHPVLNEENEQTGEWCDGPIRPYNRNLHWVIVGGESGPGARPMHPDWARSLRDQCGAAGVPFFFKQWGNWAPWATHFAADREEQGRWDTYVNLDGTTGEFAISEDHDRATNFTGDLKPGNTAVTRMGKHDAGRELDGSTHDGYPGVDRG